MTLIFKKIKKTWVKVLKSIVKKRRKEKGIILISCIVSEKMVHELQQIIIARIGPSDSP